MRELRKGVPGILALLVAMLFSVLSYFRLPDRVAVHFDASFRPDGYASRLVVGVIMPTLLLVLLPLLGVLLPRIDPRQKSYGKHRSTWWILMNVVMVFFAGIQALFIGFGLGWQIRPSRVLPLGVGALLVLIGNYLGRLRPNWFMGIRTPWTLSSDTVWRKTHRFGGWTFVVGGILLATGGFAGVTWLTLGALAIAAGFPVAYSYILWRREQLTKKRAEGISS